MLIRLLLASLLVSPAAAWAFYKPVRVLAPQWVGGIACVSDWICIDDVSRYPEASALYKNALDFVSSAVGPIQQRPRAVFCSTEACFRAFGFDKVSAITVGKSGIVVGPRGWTAYYVRHEMIHHLQAERLGVLAQWLAPKWFTEGMAYALSEDPRRTLSEPWRQYRTEFGAWYQEVGRERLWEEARKL